MYCKKCGKEIDYDADICLECKGQAPLADEHDSYSEESYYASMYAEGKARKEGLGRAIVALVLGVISVGLCSSASSTLTGMLELIGSLNYIKNISFVISWALAFAGLGFAIPAFINGIKSIQCFKKAKKSALPKPVATLVLGIASVVFSTGAFCYFVVDICAGIILLMI